MFEKTLVIEHKLGLHARPAAMFVKAASEFDSDITIQNVSGESDPVDAKSILSVLTLGVAQGHTISLAAEGPDEQESVESLVALIESNFGEKE